MPCWDEDSACGAGRIIRFRPNFENDVTCIYDAAGDIISATTCGHTAPAYCNGVVCRPPDEMPCPGNSSCVHVGANVTCNADAGSN